MDAKLPTVDHRPATISFDTAIGSIAVTWSGRGLTRVRLQLTAPHDPDTAPEAPAHVASAIARIRALLGGERADLRAVALDERGIGGFERRVYAAARDIDPGRTLTYGQLAAAIGEPGEARAVGAALARNPFLIVVPCHRVIAADGSLRGFSAPGGIETKRRLLALEGAAVSAARTLFDLAPEPPPHG